MLFNSLRFLIFFPVVSVAFFALPFRFRTLLLLLASYYFYTCWRAEYALLLLFSTIMDYWLGLEIARAESVAGRRALLAISLGSSLGLLAAFKYSSFLPVGISFYTFQSIGYVVDVYRDRTRVERNFLRFALYLAFFPQLVAGPIERASQLLPQFYRRRKFSVLALNFGVRLILWGFFKKLVIADRLSDFVGAVYGNVQTVPALSLVLATYFFAIQIYCDFSGYCDIARGSARILGFKLSINFNRPYFSASLREFWQRWHISLSTWFRDYLYIPLGGNRTSSRGRWALNLLLVFALSGMWHGANWTYGVWGALHGCALLALLVLPSWERVPRPLRVMLVFNFVVFSWVFFRASSLSDAGTVLRRIAMELHWEKQDWVAVFHLFSADNRGFSYFLVSLICIAVLAAVELGLPRLSRLSRRSIARSILQEVAMVALFVAVMMLGRFGGNEFIYFQF
jgi:alginate O-acetyltransferase complex protein AlgI